MPRPAPPKLAVIVVFSDKADDASANACLEALNDQTLAANIVAVYRKPRDNLEGQYPRITWLLQKRGKGFAAMANTGIRAAIANEADLMAVVDTRTVVQPGWLANLVDELNVNDDAGIATCKLLDDTETKIDSTGNMYTTWGLPYSRGQGEPVSDAYDERVQVFGASSSASLYRVSMLKKIGLFDDNFSAGFEGVDLSFRVQLAGWKIRYVPESIAYRQIGGFRANTPESTTSQTIKALPLILWKNAPFTVLIRILPKFIIAHYGLMFSAGLRGQGGAAMIGYLKLLWLLPKKTVQRIIIQHKRTVTSAYIWKILEPGLPPTARNKLRILSHPLKTLRGIA